MPQSVDTKRVSRRAKGGGNTSSVSFSEQEERKEFYTKANRTENVVKVR